MTTAAVGITLFGAFFVSMLVCLAIGRRAGRAAFASGHPPAGLGTVEAVTFGLLGLLLAFTFSGAANRLDNRRGQIVAEANAIGTAWLRIDVLPADAQPKVRTLFRAYTDSRIALYRTFSETGLEGAREEWARSGRLQQELWNQTIAAAGDVAYINTVVLPALNEMFDIAASRIAMTEMHPPSIVFFVLALLSLVCAGLVGYEMGATEIASRAHMLAFAFILAFTFYVILDFEYPRLGLIRVDDFDNLLVQARTSMGS